MGNFVIGLLALLFGLACAVVFGLAMGAIIGVALLIVPLLWVFDLTGWLKRRRSTSR